MIGGILVAAAAATALAGETPGQQWTLGFALGKGFVGRHDNETAAMQYRLEYRNEAIYVAHRGSWIAEVCRTSPNPKELSLLAGVSIPMASGRVRFNAAIGVGMTYVHGNAFTARTGEVRIKLGAFGLTAFWNFNDHYDFHAVCASVDLPLWSR